MSTYFWGVENNSVVSRTIDEVKDNIQKSKFNILLEEVASRYRVLVNNNYYWLDQTSDDSLIGLTRYGGNNSDIAELVIREVYNCSDSVCEHDDTSRLVEVGLLDLSDLDEGGS